MVRSGMPAPAAAAGAAASELFTVDTTSDESPLSSDEPGLTVLCALSSGLALAGCDAAVLRPRVD